jgi:hypothetical protein
MKLLIIEDNPELAKVTSDLLMKHEEGMPIQDRRITSTFLVSNLEMALDLLPVHDAVLCDGEFFPRPGCSVTNEYWAIVASHARDLWMPCVVYSGSDNVLQGCQRAGVAALMKPTKVEVLYAVIVAVFDSMATLRADCSAGVPTGGAGEDTRATGD